MTDLITAETQTRINYLRAKSADNTITLEEMTEVIKLVRQGRVAAQTAAAKSVGASKAKGPTKSTDELFKELGL